MSELSPKYASVAAVTVALVLCFSVARCGSSSSNPQATSTPGASSSPTPTPGTSTTPTPTATEANTVTLQITLQSFAFDTSAATMASGLLRYELNDPNSAFHAQGTPSGGNDVTSCATAGGVVTCTTTLANFNVTSYTHGLLVLTADNRPSATTPLWREVYTLIPQSAITAARSASNNTLAVTAAIMTDGGENDVATWAGLSSSADYLTNGAFMGVVLASDGVTPVANATLTTGANNYTVAYANNTATSPQTGSTSVEGLFLAVSAGTTAVANTDWTLSATGSSATWGTLYTGTVPYALTVMYIKAQ